MPLSIVPRSKWGAKPAESFVAADPKKLKGVVVHWFGSPKGTKDHADCPKVLRAVQRTHMAGEFTDIAYNHAVCQHGVVYALRGFDRQTGANGNKTANRQYAAVVAMIGEGDRPSGELKNGLRDVIAEWRARGAGVEVKRHGEITGSACPGPDLSSWVSIRAFEKLPPPRKPKPPVEPSTPTIPAKVEWRIDVDVPGELQKLRDQDPDSPAVQTRVEAWKKRFGRLTVSWKRK